MKSYYERLYYSIVQPKSYPMNHHMAKDNSTYKKSYMCNYNYMDVQLWSQFSVLPRAARQGVPPSFNSPEQ